MKLLKKLSEAAGVPGAESNIRKLVKAELKEHCKLTEDALGNLIAYKKSGKKNAKKLMITSHMDEIGFYVSKVDKKGFIRICDVGGFDCRNLFARKVNIHTDKGILKGVLHPGITPLHLSKPEERKKVPEVSEFFIDTGLSAKKVQAQVQVGDMVTLEAKFEEFGDLVSGKALDNRCCVWLGINLIKKAKKLNYDLYCVFTVQEEVGLRGAGVAANNIRPDLAINLDTTIGDAPFGVPEYRQVSVLGDGVCIKVLDRSVICDQEIVKKLVRLAKSKKVKYQMEVLVAGGTDSGAVQRSGIGVKTGALSIPTRNIHTVTEMIHPEDLNEALKLLKAFVSA